MRRLFALFVAMLLLGGSLGLVAAQDDVPPDPRVGDAVAFVDVDGIELATFSVDDLVDPFEDSADDPPRNSRFVLVALTVDNTGDDAFPFDPFSLVLQDANGFLYFPDEVDLGDEEPLEPTELDEGDALSGAIAFSVPEEAAPLVRVFYFPTDDQLVLLAELGGGNGPEPTEEPTGECEGVDAWLADTQDRLDQADAIFEEILSLEDDDPALVDTIRDGTDELADLAAEQEETDVPAEAEELNDLVIDTLNTYADGLAKLADAIEESDQDLADEAIDDILDADALASDALDGIDQLAADCGLGDENV